MIHITVIAGSTSRKLGNELITHVAKAVVIGQEWSLTLGNRQRLPWGFSWCGIYQAPTRGLTLLRTYQRRPPYLRFSLEDSRVGLAEPPWTSVLF